MKSRDAIRTLNAMGLSVTDVADGVSLSVEGHSLSLGQVSDWRDVVQRAGRWLDELGEQAGRDGERLAHRRQDAGFAESAAFCDFCGLDDTQVYEAELGLTPATPVHLRILDWIEEGRLKINAVA